MFTVVYPPFIKFDHMFQRPQQLFTHLARRGVQAVYHDPGMSGRRPPYMEREPNLFLLSSDAPLSSVPHHAPVLWISYPPYWQLINRYYHESLVVFDICDAPADEFADWEQGTGKMLERADLVFCASWPLYQQYAEEHPNVYFCPNGVDYEHFSTPIEGASPLDHLHGHIIGYHGAVASWLDWTLIEEIARLRRDWNFVFVGPPYNLSAHDLPRLPNLNYCDQQPYSQLPGYVQAFDAGIVPFRPGEMTRASDPIKAYEYLAAGKGVVATSLPQLVNNPWVHTADTASAFIRALETVLGEGEEFRAHRQRWAQNQSWSRRAALIVSALQAFLPHDEDAPADQRGASPLEEELAAFLQERVPATSYLEAGMRSGLTSACLVSKERRIAAVDIDPGQVGPRHHWGVETYRASMFQLPFADGEFDVVWNAGGLGHYPPSRQIAALKEFTRVASRAVVVAIPNRDCLPYRLGRHIAQLATTWPLNCEDTYSTLAPLFGQAGLEAVEETGICPQAAEWFLDQYLPGWDDFLPRGSLGQDGTLLAVIGHVE